jgi:hypothetical protein
VIPEMMERGSSDTWPEIQWMNTEYPWQAVDHLGMYPVLYDIWRLTFSQGKVKLVCENNHNQCQSVCLILPLKKNACAQWAKQQRITDHAIAVES